MHIPATQRKWLSPSVRRGGRHRCGAEEVWTECWVLTCTPINIIACARCHCSGVTKIDPDFRQIKINADQLIISGSGPSRVAECIFVFLVSVRWEERRLLGLSPSPLFLPHRIYTAAPRWSITCHYPGAEYSYPATNQLTSLTYYSYHHQVTSISAKGWFLNWWESWSKKPNVFYATLWHCM